MSKKEPKPKHLAARSSFDTPLSINLYVGIVTYLVLTVYCLLCLRNIDEMFITEINGLRVMTKDAEKEKLIYILQFCMDAFFPSTLTLVISIIVQNIVEIGRRARSRWGWTGIAIAAALVYTMVGGNMRLIESTGQFMVIAVCTVVLLILCFAAIFQIQKHSEQGGRIAAQR